MDAIKSYNWKGMLTGYQYENSWIPIESSHYLYRELLHKIENGTCIVQEPRIEAVEKAYDKHKTFCGYTYLGMFVPINKTNNLYNLIQSYIDNNVCKVMEPNIGNQLDNYIEKRKSSNNSSFEKSI